MACLTVTILALIAFSSFGTSQSCEDKTLNCILPYFGKNTNDDTADTYLGLSDVGVASDVIVPLEAFSARIERPLMRVEELNSAQIQGFSIAEDASSVSITMYFPEVHLSGTQRIVFTKAGETDVTVEMPYDYRIGGITATAEYELVNLVARLDTQTVASSINNTPPIIALPLLAPTGIQYPWVGEILVEVAANPELFFQEYMDTLGRVLFNLYWDRIFAVA